MFAFIIISGVVLIAFNFRAIYKDKKSFKGVLHSAEYNIEDIDVKIGELRREFAESLLDIQKEIDELKNQNESNLNSLDKKERLNTKEINKNDDNKTIDNFQNSIAKNIVYENNTTESSVNENKKTNNNLKVQDIETLLAKNKSIDEIAEILKIGKGEVLLIKELYLK